jgi:two-component system phosphate regulon sensor histidine kinase PhoR
VTGVLFRRLLLITLALLAATMFAVDYTLTRSTGEMGVNQVRTRILAISAGSFLLAFLIAFFFSRSLSSRVRRLKTLAESIPGGAAVDRPREESRDEMGSLERSLGGVAIEVQKLLENLRYESARRATILSGMAEGVLAVDQDLRVTFSNAAFLKAIEFRGMRSEGRFLLELIRDTGLHELLRSVLATGEPQKQRFRLSTLNARIFEVQATPLEMASGHGAIAILHDITDLERLEQVRKDFVANVSHELRTPLAGIIGYADTLLDGALNDERHSTQFVEIIRTNAVRLANIAQDLLILSELESGSEPLEPERISVCGVVDSAIATVASEARARDVNIVRENVDDLYIDGSRLRLEQALLNLLANAIKFNRPGGEVRVRAALNPSGQVAITIADTGVGIPSEDVPRIFERFYRVDKARSRQVGGTGLGLSIVKHIVERMKGTVRVESQLGRGSTFTLLLPEGIAQESPLPRAQSPLS